VSCDTMATAGVRRSGALTTWTRLPTIYDEPSRVTTRYRE
jgi:hypothetical protein